MPSIPPIFYKMKIVAQKPYISFLPNNQVAVSFVTDFYSANRLVREMDQADIVEVNVKERKSIRSLNQNNFMWAIIEKVSMEINGERSEESVMKIYAEILTQANVNRELVAVLPKTLDALKRTFRAVVETGQTIETINEETGKKSKLVTAWVYEGSSRFNVKEMNELLDYAIEYARKAEVIIDELYSLYGEKVR